jgi:hypothetical protein
MWDEQKRHRFQELQRREQEGILLAREREELSALVSQLLLTESAYLGPATERLRLEREGLDAQNRKLEGLAARKAALAERLERFLAEADAERRTIEGEVDAVLAGI